MKNSMTRLQEASETLQLCDIIDVENSNYEEVTKKKGKENTSSRRMMSRMQYQDLKGIL